MSQAAYAFSLEWSDPSTIALPTNETVHTEGIEIAIEVFAKEHGLQVVEMYHDKDTKGRHITVVLFELPDRTNAEYAVYVL